MTLRYALVHLVAQESTKDLIGPQVLDHAASQANAGDPDRPAAVAAAFLEPARHAVTGAVRRRIRAHRSRNVGVRAMLLPYIGRLGLHRNARLLAYRLRSFAHGLPIVLHCRGESATAWGIALATHLARAGIVADIRGASPEELLFARGFDTLDDADAEARRSYDSAMIYLRQVLRGAGAVLSVSPTLIDWLESLGTPRSRLTYVPCCVAGITFDSGDRKRIREQLGLNDRLVFCYMGTITGYQHVADGVIPFFRAAAAEAPDAHLLCVTPQREQMRALVDGAAIPADRVTIISAGQREVGAYLSAADAGLLLRAPSRLNQFSQPTKLGEYLSAGVPVIVARGTGRVDQLIAREGAGSVVTVFGLDDDQLRREVRSVCDDVRTCGELWRENALSLCRRHFMWNNYTTSVREAYRGALEFPKDSIERGATLT